MNSLPFLLIPTIILSLSVPALADDDTDEGDAKAAPTADEKPAKVVKKGGKAGAKGDADDADDAEPEDKDEARFRGGISGGGGALIYAGRVAGLGGLDGRIGAQIIDLVGLYVQPHVALGAGSGLFAGSLGGTLVIDFTFIDHIFVGVGGGGGLVQFGGTEAAGMLHFRAGGYPVVGFGEDGIRRKGLMLGADVIVHFAAGQVLPSPMVSIGYEAF
jgi:hypothetical protein